MDIHKNARSCPASRELLVTRIVEEGWSVSAAAKAAGLSRRSAQNWLRRFRDHGRSGLLDRSSRPHRSRNRVSDGEERRIVKLRRQYLTVRQVAVVIGRSHSTVARVLKRHGLSRLRSLDPIPAPVRYEHSMPGELLHMDIKKLGRIDGVGHRITGDRKFSKASGWEYVHVCVDDHSRVAYAEVIDGQDNTQVIPFLERALKWYAARGVRVRRLLTDNGSAYISNAFRAACDRFNLRHVRTRPYRPQTNGKVERLIQTLLREWAYRFAFSSSFQRSCLLPQYLHFYNIHRAHTALGYNPPISRLSGNNLLRLDS